MSIRTVSASPTTSNAGLNTKSLQGAISPTPWVRNPQWLTLPTVLSSEQKMVGLHAIFPSSNFFALVAAGDYTVNWGDGVTENFTANTVAYHEYDYTNAAFNGTLTDAGYKQAIVTVTPQAGQNLTYLNLNQRHNQANLQAYTSGFLDISVSSPNLTDLRVCVSTPSSTTGTINFNLLEQFSLINSDCKQLNNFFNAARSLQSIPNFVTSANAPVTASVTFTDAGDLVTLASHGFRNGDSVLFTTITSTTGVVVNTTYYIINATTNTFQISTTYGGAAVNLVNDGTGTVVYGTTMFNMFSSCSALTTTSLFNTTAVISMQNMFVQCNALKTIPLLNTAAVINMATMFAACRSLTTIPLLNTAAVTDMTNMFQNCSSLTTIPLLNTAAVIIMDTMFASCSSLTTIPLLNTAAVTSMGSMFTGCTALKTIPLLNTASVTNMSSMFNGCNALKTIPLLNTAAVTIIAGMFVQCRSLTTIPLLNTAAVTNMSQMFFVCSSLTTVPPLVTTAVNNFSSMFTQCPSLTRIEAKDFRFTFSVANCKLSATALNEIYTNLPTVTGQTITVSGNYGTATDDPTIATAKGWTVSG